MTISRRPDTARYPAQPFPGQGVALVAWLVFLSIWTVLVSGRAWVVRRLAPASLGR
jgi:hypothetical protein